MHEKSSMLYWFPLVRDVDVPCPKTVLIERHMNPSHTSGEAVDLLDLEWVMPRVELSIRTLGGPPVFIRTDQMSAKHDYRETCYYDGSRPLRDHIVQLCQESWAADVIGLRVSGFAVREYLELDAGFKAFGGGLPIARERRYFVEDGVVLCHHPYWPKDAIWGMNLPPNWEQILGGLNTESCSEISLLSKYAVRIGERLSGYWSFDFAYTKRGGWVFIDAAEGLVSWHPECSFAKRAEPSYAGREPV